MYRAALFTAGERSKKCPENLPRLLSNEGATPPLPKPANTMQGQNPLVSCQILESKVNTRGHLVEYELSKTKDCRTSMTSDFSSMNGHRTFVMSGFSCVRLFWPGTSQSIALTRNGPPVASALGISWQAGSAKRDYNLGSRFLSNFSNDQPIGN